MDFAGKTNRQTRKQAMKINIPDHLSIDGKPVFFTCADCAVLIITPLLVLIFNRWWYGDENSPPEYYICLTVLFMSSEIYFGLKETERNAVRVVLIDKSSSILLISTRDGSNPDFIKSWELPGGGIQEGESHVEAIMREVYEETGFKINPQFISEPLWFRDVYYSYRGERRLQHESISTAYINCYKPRVNNDNREPFELEDHLDFHWWSVDELISETVEIFYPRSLPRHINKLILGERINDPIEIWN